jgi:hypothetical protein
MVFDDLDQAAKYRQYVCNTLKSSSADIVTLCGNKLSGRGVVLGSGFKVMPVEQAPCRFGTIPRAQQVQRIGCLSSEGRLTAAAIPICRQGCAAARDRPNCTIVLCAPHGLACMCHDRQMARRPAV